MDVTIRVEMPGDQESIRRVNRAAFGQDCGEAELVDKLRSTGALTLSMVAVSGRDVVGHIAFSPVTVECADKTVHAIGLGPMAVEPEHQRKGIGSRLVETGLAAVRDAGHEIVAVIGHPEFYPRFGFTQAVNHDIRWEHNVPDEAFMVTELRPGALQDVSGMLRFGPEFDEL